LHKQQNINFKKYVSIKLILYLHIFTVEILGKKGTGTVAGDREFLGRQITATATQALSGFDCAT